MSTAHFKEAHLVMPVSDVKRSVHFYVDQLGFRISFRDPTGPDQYVGVRRDGVELHLQWQRVEDMPPRGIVHMRFFVDDPDALFAEYSPKGVFHDKTRLEDKPWGTREFAFFDPDGNALTFYRDR